MQQHKRRRSDRALRARMQSPGRPPVARREDRQRFWAAIAKGLTSEDAGVAAGISPVVGTRWFRQSGGMPTVSQAPLSGRYLSFAEREEVALLRASGSGVRSIARRLHRAPSTISRELRRNAATRGGYLDYRADLTHEKWHPARGVCLTSNVTLGSSKSEPRGKSEVFDELPWQTRVVGAGGAAL